MATEQEEIEVRKRLALDANILIRGVFGIRVRSLLETYETTVSFYAPDICFLRCAEVHPQSGGAAQV
jgi:hypothetical protein